VLLCCFEPAFVAGRSRSGGLIQAGPAPAGVDRSSRGPRPTHVIRHDRALARLRAGPDLGSCLGQQATGRTLAASATCCKRRVPRQPGGGTSLRPRDRVIDRMHVRRGCASGSAPPGELVAAGYTSVQPGDILGAHAGQPHTETRGREPSSRMRRRRVSTLTP